MVWLVRLLVGRQLLHDAEPDVIPVKLIDAASESDNVSPIYSFKVQLIVVESSILFSTVRVILSAALVLDALAVNACLFKGHATVIFV